ALHVRVVFEHEQSVERERSGDAVVGAGRRLDHGAVVDDRGLHHWRVVAALDHEGGRGGRDAALAVGDVVGVDQGDALALGQVVVGGRVDHKDVAGHGHAAGIVAAGLGQVGDRERVPFHVGGAGQQVDAEAGGVLVGGRDQGRRQGRIVDRGDVGEDQFAGIGQAAVADGVGRSGHRAVVVRSRGEAVAAIGIDHQRADAGNVRGLAGVVDGRVAGDGELRDDEVVAIDIAVVVEHVARDRRVFDHHDRPVVVRDGGVVDGGDGDRHVDGGGAAVAVIDGDGEAVGAVVVRIGRVGVAAGLRVEDQGAVLRRGGDGVGERVAVDVAAGDGAGGRRVLVDVERGRGG